jgi:hypothetical protein
MMRDVILEIGKAEKHFENFFVFGGVAIESAICQGVNGVWRIREEPREYFFVDQTGFDAVRAHLIRAFDYHLEEVIEADAVDRQGRQNFVSTAVNMATPCHSRSCLLCPREERGKVKWNDTPVLGVRVGMCWG